MKLDKKRDSHISVALKDFDQAQVFLEDLLGRSQVSPRIASETMVVFEALYGLFLMQGFDSDTMLDITGEHRLDDFSIKISFDGKRFNPSDDNESGSSPELRIVEGYGEKISHSYHHGYNTVRIAVRTTPEAFLVSCGIGFLLAVVAYLLICLFMDADARHMLQQDYVFPVESLLGNALLMVGPPVTLLSLLKNASDVFIASERNTDSRRLWGKVILTSCIAILLALLTAALFYFLYINYRGFYSNYVHEVVDHSFAAVVVSMVPASIFEPFEAISPIPLVLLAGLVTYALCHASSYFDVLKKAINACYELFSWMLRAVMVALPFFCFLAFLDALLDIGFRSLLHIVMMIVAFIVGVIILLASYAIRLRLKGVKVRTFMKELMPLLRENVAINSSIDAVPYNIRFCAKHFGMRWERLTRNMPILAQLSLDGNCYLLMLIAMICVFISGDSIPWVNIIAIAALVLFLEFGAPNQPGGILIGTLIIMTYLNLPGMLRMAIYLEVLLGTLQNIINVISNIVMMVEDEGVRYSWDRK